MTGLVIPRCPHKVGLARGPVASCSENSTAVSWTQVEPLGAAVAGQGGSTAEGKVLTEGVMWLKGMAQCCG